VDVVVILCKLHSRPSRIDENGTKITITVSKPDRLITDRIVKARRIEGRSTCSPAGC
jgi:hypothetical protein